MRFVHKLYHLNFSKQTLKCHFSAPATALFNLIVRGTVFSHSEEGVAH